MKRTPNILFVFPDQHRGDWLPYDRVTFNGMGITEDFKLNTPNFKYLMDNGVTFANTVTPSPLCGPARACLATGRRYPAYNTVVSSEDCPRDVNNFYKILKDRGYEVAVTGKTDLHKYTKFWGIDGISDAVLELGITKAHDIPGKAQIFKIQQRNDGIVDEYTKFLTEIGELDTYIADMKRRSGDGKEKELMSHPTKVSHGAYADNWVGDRSVELIESFDENRPWFLHVNFLGPHPPWDAPEKMRVHTRNIKFPSSVGNDKYDGEELNSVKQAYGAMIENIDFQLGRMIETIKQRGELENTIIIYSSDHGEMMGDLGYLGKRLPYRGSINIPLIICDPNGKKGIVSHELAELQDIAATIAKYAGYDFIEGIHSADLSSVVRGENKNIRDYQVSGYKQWRTISDGTYKLISDDGDCRLYDIKSDPWELTDISKEYPEITEKLKLRINEEFKQ